MENLNQVIQNKVGEYSSSIEQTVDSNQSITIDCGTDKLTPWHLEPRNEKYTWYGKKIPHSGCPQFGCCYDVTQQSQVKIQNMTKISKTKNLRSTKKIKNSFPLCQDWIPKFQKSILVISIYLKMSVRRK